MAALQKFAGAYLVILAAAVAVFFIINPFLVGSLNVMSIWYALDVLMLIGLAIALVFNYSRKSAEGGRDPGEPVTRRYLEVNAAFFLTAGVAILFLHNWFSLLSLGAEQSLGGGSALNHQAWVIWAVVDTLLPLTLGVTGCRLWQESSQS